MITAIAAAKALVVPLTLAIALIVLRRRSANRWCLFAAFFAGFLGAFSLNSALLRVLPSGLPADRLNAATAGQAWFSGFVEAAIPEEVAKGLWILVFAVGWRQYSASHGALIGGLVGLGFALRENLSFAQIAPEWRVMAGMCHGAWGLILGHLLEAGLKRPSRRFEAVLCAFIPPVLLHGLLDTSIFLVDAHAPAAEVGLQAGSSQTQVGPILLLEMFVTLAAFAISIAWAGRVAWRARRTPVEQVN